MQTQAISFWEWQEKFKKEAACTRHLIKLRWPNGFICPQCHHTHGYYYEGRKHYECAECHKQTSVTLFHGSKVSLRQWFWAIFYMGSDKGGISALRLSKLIDVNWKTAFQMLRKMRAAMGNQDSIYGLSGTVELGDAYVGGKKAGKRGRGAMGKISVLFNSWQ
ncbi:Mobile element protein [hydrothermal vent metagenome]|uniref:Mobile element protein n=1 Tax=hydrothermal vent metagenome TaxID=652676 RepID=A0A3B0WB56_9ZZZZ